MHVSRLLAGIVLVVVLPSVAQAQFWCWDADEVIAEVEGDVVRIQHLAALYNYCPDPITYDIEVGDATILIVENTQFPCDYECCYDLELTVSNMPPGPWNLLFQWFEVETWQWTERILEIIIPDVGQEPEPVLKESSRSDCLEPSAVPELPEALLTWGFVKTMYR